MDYMGYFHSELGIAPGCSVLFKPRASRYQKKRLASLFDFRKVENYLVFTFISEDSRAFIGGG